MPISSIFSTSNYQRPDGFGGIATPEGGEKAAFQAVKKAALARCGVSPRGVNDFNICITSRTGYFTNPGTGNTEEVDLLAPGCKDAFDGYTRIVPGARNLMNYWSVSSGCKGDQGGNSSLRKSTSSLIDLPRDIDFDSKIPKLLARHSSSDERHKVARSFVFVEAYLSKFREKVDGLIESKQKELKDSSLPDSQANRLQKELKELRALKGKLESVDLFAISTVLEHLPAGHANTQVLASKEEEVRKAVLDRIKPNLKQRIFGKKPTQLELEYANDVAGMLYQGRKSYYDYAEKMFGGRPKQEHVSDIFLREARVFGSMNPYEEYGAEGFIDSVLLQDMSDDLKAEMQGVLGGLGRVTSHACKEMNMHDYIEQTVPTGKSDEEKVKVQVDQMRATLSDHRTEVQAKMGLDPSTLPMPVVPSPGVGSALRTGLGVAAAGGLIATAASYAGVSIPAGMTSVMSYFSNSPGRVIAGVTIADSLRHRVHDFVRPRQRVPWMQRKLSYKRLALAGGVAVLAAYVVPMAYAAATPFLAAMEPPTTSPIQPHMLMAAPQAMSGLEPPIVPGLLAQAGIFGTLVLQAAGRAVDFVWNSSHIPTGLGTRRIPLLGWNWQGSIPTAVALQLGNAVTSRIPVVRSVAEVALRPLRYVATSSALAPAAAYAQQVGQGVSERIGLPAMLNAFKDGFSTDGCPAYSSNLFEQMSVPERLACKAVLAWGRFQNWWELSGPSLFSQS